MSKCKCVRRVRRPNIWSAFFSTTLNTLTWVLCNIFKSKDVWDLQNNIIRAYRQWLVRPMNYDLEDFDTRLTLPYTPNTTEICFIYVIWANIDPILAETNLKLQIDPIRAGTNLAKGNFFCLIAHLMVWQDNYKK